jgi:phospho-N-acetylmuramoyl-pentapeptide-transferase
VTPDRSPSAGHGGTRAARQHAALLPVLGGLYVVETCSVIAQVISPRFGRRVLRMAPIHHHFEVGGWPEFTVIVRLWLFAGACVALGLGLFYANFINIPGVID